MSQIDAGTLPQSGSSGPEKAASIGGKLLAVLQSIDALTAEIREFAADAVLDDIDAGSELISRAIEALAEGKVSPVAAAKKALQAA